MSSIPRVVPVNKRSVVTLKLTPGWLAALVLGLVLVGALLATGTHIPAWQAYLAQRSAEDLAAHEQAVQEQAAASHKASVEVLKQRAAYLADLQEHPERYRVEWSHTIQPTDEDLKRMSEFGGARGEQDAGAVYSGSLDIPHIPIPFDYWGITAKMPLSMLSALACGASVSVSPVGNLSGGHYFIDEAQTPNPYPEEEYEEWMGWAAIYCVLRISIGAPGDGTTADYAVWLGDRLTSNVEFEPHFGDAPLPVVDAVLTTIPDISWSISLTDAYRRAKTTESIPAGYAYLRDTRQLTGTGHWFADEDTEVSITATVGETTLSASGNYGATEETDLTEGLLLGITPSISLNYAPDAHTDYATVTCDQCDFTNWTFYRVTGDDGDWHWRGDTTEGGYDPEPDAADIIWQTVPSGSSIGIQAGDGYSSGAEDFEALTLTKNWKIHPRLWKQNKVSGDETETSGDGWARYTEYDDSQGHPFDLGLYQHPGETEADVSVAPSWDGIEYTETWTFAYDGVPADKWRKFTNSGNGITVSLRKDWLEANNEDVPFTDPTTMEEATGDIRQQLTMHPLDIELDEVPWHDDWITWERVELNLDKPEGTRPSLWTGVGAVDVTGEVWTIPAAGGTVSRTLAANVRRNRLKRMNDHLWTGSGDQQQVSDDWPLMTRHDLDIGVTGDDPKWRDSGETPWPGDEVGIDYEDISDWRGFSCVEAEFSNVSEDQTVQLRLTYRYLSGANPYYVGASYKYGTELGEFESSWSSTQTVTIDGTLYAGTGKVKWDLAPDAGEAAWIEDAELVETVEFIFPETSGEQALTFVGFDTVAYAGDGTDEQVVRTAHLHQTDWFGGRIWVDGMPDYQPTYLYTMDSERVEVGYKNVQQAKHNPDSELTDDITSLKSLARWYNEQTYAETLMDPTWGTAAYNAALVDEDTTTLSVPYCTDYDEDGFCLHVGVHDDCNSPGPVHIYCDCILQGGVRGVAKKDGVRAPGYEGDVRLYRSTDGGTTLDQIASADTDSQGAYRIGSGREKAPRTYYVKGVWEPTVSLGGFVNAEEHWAAVAVGDVPEGRKVDMFRHPFGNVPWTAWISGGDLKVAETFDGKLTLGTVRTLDTSAAYSSVSADTDGNTIYVDAVKTADETLWRWYSDDHGETWTGPTQLA